MADNMGKSMIPSTTSHSLDKQEKQESDGEKELESEPRFCSNRRELFSSSGLGEAAVDGCEGSGSVMQYTLVMGGRKGNDDGKMCGGARGGGESGGGDDGGGGDGDSGFFESDSTDVYYQMMIEANQGNSLFLGNYAKFLKEVRGDFGRAEYCSRAILANPNDGNFLSLYVDLIWHNQRDIQRAKTYLDQAVKNAPND